MVCIYDIGNIQFFFFTCSILFGGYYFSQYLLGTVFLEVFATEVPLLS